MDNIFFVYFTVFFLNMAFLIYLIVIKQREIERLRLKLIEMRDEITQLQNLVEDYKEIHNHNRKVTSEEFYKALLDSKRRIK